MMSRTDNILDNIQQHRTIRNATTGTLLSRVCMLTMVLMFAAAIVCGTAGAATIAVCSSGCDYTTIQAAVNAASVGDTIIVGDGTYIENVNVGKRLTIRSENGYASTIVQAADSNDHVFEVTDDYVSISGFTVTGAYGGGGIDLDTVDYCNISYNNALHNANGIVLEGSDNNTLNGNIVKYNADNGIWLYFQSNNNKLIDNIVNFNINYGIALYVSNNNNMLIDNNASNNNDGIHLSTYSNYNIVSGNTAINNSNYGVSLYSSNSNRIYNNYFDNTNNAYDDGSNIWNTTKTAGASIIGEPYLGGNYWSGYAGEDLDSDGLGDTLLPYNASGNIENGGDWLPLVQVGGAFNIGSIPPHSIWHGDTAEFVICSDELGPGATFSATADPQPLGVFSLDSYTGLFSYTPDSEDKEQFSVTFTATLGNDSQSQTVEFDPMPHLPPEQVAFGLDPVHAVPDPEDKDYLLVNTVLSETPESFNCVVRNTRTISISGKTVVFQDGHNNGLYSYSGSDDIKEMNIYAETVVIQSPLHLPQTNVIIYARELRFENTGCIDTTPKSNTTRPAQFQNGDHGLKAGDIELHIESFYSDPGHNTRFILHGGNGQPAGLGKPGQKGEDMVTRDDWGSLAPPWPDNITYWEVGSYQFCSFFYMGCVWGGTGKWGDQTRWPGDGGNAKPAGKPGNGGTGGNLAASLNLASYVDNGGGAAGAKGDDALGGRGGLPNPAYRTRTTLQSPPCCPFLPLTDDCFVSDSILNRMLGPWQIVVVDHHATWWVIVEEHSSNAGLNAYAPDPDIAIGQSGTFSLISNGISWLHPYAMKMVIAHAKDTYLYGHVDVTEEILVDYMEVLDTYRNSTEWNELDETQRLEFGQMQNEMQILLHRINNNLDYFGNPAGWVPMLSFEVSKAAFEQETDHAIRVLYLCYWIGNAETDIQEKVNALSYAREKKSEEIQDFKDQYNELMDLIPRLQVEGEAVANQEELLNERLKQREQELLKRAEHNVEERHKVPWWKKATRVLGAICSLCPIGQPVPGIIGGGLGLISNFDPDTPWESIDDLESFSKMNYTKYGKDCEALGDTIKGIPDDKLNLTLMTGYVKEIGKKSVPILKEAEKYKDILKETEIPQSDVDAELIKIRATDPEFNQLAGEIAELMARKKALGKQLAKSIQMTSTLSNAITFDLLAIDGMNRDIADGNAVLDHRASAYLKEMEQRETERLLKYHYYMAKAHEYRLLEPYSGELDLDSLFNKFKDIAEAADSDHNLNSGNFNALKALYEGQLSTLAEGIYDTYQSNPPELSAPIRFNISQEEIQKLNTGEPVTVNLVELGMFPLSDENIRIVKLKVNALDAHPEDGDLGEWAHMDIHMEHSGLSKLVHDGEVYQFRHYNLFTENPITWRARYDGIDHTIDSIEPSTASGSLLRSFISLPEGEILIYSRPAAWADITLTKDVNTQTGIDMVIDSLRLEAIYDFTPKDSNKVKLQVLVSEDGLLPYFIADTKDLNNRQDGRGNFHRTYYKNPSDKVTVKAPASYGVWQFEKWTDRYGNDLGGEPTNRVLELNLGADQTICAQMYAPPIASFTYSPEYPSVDENIAFNASSSYDPDGYITNYKWDFGDGNITNTTEDILMHSYSSAENYMVNLTVTDDKGAINSKSVVITITGLRGDLDNDSRITAADAVIALQMVVRGEHNNRADMDSDGQVTSLDALMILQVAAGAISL